MNLIHQLPVRHANCLTFFVNNLLESRQLRLFVELAERSNMHRAAKVLGLTPSALSHALKRLEEELGCSLFDRQGRGLALSANGRLFLPEAKAILEKIESARHRFHAQLDWRRGRLRIGSTSAGCSHILPAVIREYRDSFPQISIHIIEGSTDELIEGLRADEVDFALCVNQREQRGFEQIALANESLVFLVNPLHPWARHGRLQRDEISDQKFILSETDSDAFHVIDHYFRVERIQISPFIEVRSEALIKKLVELDMGVAILPEWIAREEIETGRLVAFQPGKRALERKWELLHILQRELNFAETLFTGLTRMVARHLIPSN